MSQINITNLAGGALSLDLTLDDGNIVIRENIPEGGVVDVGDQCTIDDLNRSSEVQALISASTISIAHQAEAGDIAEEVKLNNSVYMGAPILADPNRLVDILDPVADGALSIIAQPDVPRNLTITITDADDSASGVVALVGLDALGRALADTFTFGGGTKLFVGTKMYASLTTATVSSTAGAAAGDTIQVGVGDVIGLPTDIAATTAVKYTSLGAVPVTPDAIAVGTSLSGIDVNGATYDGTKVMTCIYNTGE